MEKSLLNILYYKIIDHFVKKQLIGNKFISYKTYSVSNKHHYTYCCSYTYQPQILSLYSSKRKKKVPQNISKSTLPPRLNIAQICVILEL